MTIPRFTVDEDTCDKNGRYYMLSYLYLGQARYVVYDTEEKKFYDWDTSLTLLTNIYPEYINISSNHITYYESNLKSLIVYIFEKEMIDLFSEDIMLYYGLESLIKGAEKAVIESML